MALAALFICLAVVACVVAVCFTVIACSGKRDSDLEVLARLSKEMVTKVSEAQEQRAREVAVLTDRIGELAGMAHWNRAAYREAEQTAERSLTVPDLASHMAYDENLEPLSDDEVEEIEQVERGVAAYQRSAQAELEMAEADAAIAAAAAASVGSES